MKDTSASSLAQAAAALDSALIRRLADGATVGIRVSAPSDMDADPACATAAAFAILAELRLIFPNAAGALDLPPAMLKALGPKAIAAASHSASFQAQAVTLELDENSLASLGEDGLAMAEKLKARGFHLRLKCASMAPLGLSQRTRDIFSGAQASASEALAAAGNSKNVWSDPMARRLVSAKAAKLELVADNASPEDAAELASIGFSAASFLAAA